VFRSRVARLWERFSSCWSAIVPTDCCIIAWATTSSPTRFTMRSIFSTLTRMEDCSARARDASAAPATPGIGSKKPNFSGAAGAAGASKRP